jgi:toxin secretion/phage lysis holin
MIEYTQTELRIMALFSALGVLSSYLIGGLDKLLIALLILITIDYFTGIIAAWKLGQLNSKKGFEGIIRKMMMLLIIIVAHWVDVALGGADTLRTMVIFAYIGNEGLSIVENIDRLGYGEFIPQVIKDKLAQLRLEKGDERK